MKTKIFSLIFTIIFLVISKSKACHDDTMVCNAFVNVSLGAQCSAEVTPELILFEVCPDRIYDVNLYDDPDFTNEIPNYLDASHIGMTIYVKVADLTSGNACTSIAEVVDNTPPFIDFVGAPAELSCMDDLEEVISIGVFDNCGQSSAKIVDITHECVPCEYDKVFIEYELSDEYGNIAYETKEFEFSDFCVDVEFPPDVVFECPPEPDEIPGLVFYDSDKYCPLTIHVNYSDIKIGCDITRIYTLTEECSGRSVQHTQIIDVEVPEPPQVHIIPPDGPISLEDYNDGFRPLYEIESHCDILFTTTDQIPKEVISCDPVIFIVLYEIQTVDVCFNYSAVESVLVEVEDNAPPKVKIKGRKDCNDEFIVTAEPRDMAEPINYSWTSSNPDWTITPIPGTNQALVNPGGGSTIIEVTATDAIGCTQTDSKRYYCKRNPFALIQNSNTQTLSPNPTNGTVILRHDEKIASLEIYSLSGQRLFHLSNIDNQDLEINITDFRPGLYLVRIEAGNEKWTEKLIKE